MAGPDASHGLNPLLYYSLQLLIPSVILIHLFLSPYTKVEESFNIQAVHDILEYGIPLTNQTAYLADHYDHSDYPGSVPRTFVGALGLAAAAAPFKYLFSLDGAQLQLLVRAIIGLANAAAFASFSHAVSQAFGTVASTWYILLQATQFHAMYYASRPLPNSLALPLTTLSLRSFTLAVCGAKRKRARRAATALALTTVAAVILRAELALFAAAQAAYLLLTQPSLSSATSLLRKAILPAGIGAATLALATSVVIDSFFWRAPLWPEWTAFRYNALAGNSSAWGTEPWHWYGTAALPRLLLNPAAALLCIPAALAARTTRPAALAQLAPPLAFVAAYSALPHKEWRFVVYAVPALTAAAAAGASAIWLRRRRSWAYFALAATLAASLAASAAASAGILLVSRLNYPGGAALATLHALVPAGVQASAGSNIKSVQTGDMITVHLSDLACQSGTTRFLQRRAWSYDKRDNACSASTHAYAIAEDSATCHGPWARIGAVRAFGGVSLSLGEGKGEGESVARALLGDLGAPGSAAGRVVDALEGVEEWARARVGRWPRVRMERRLVLLAARAGE